MKSLSLYPLSIACAVSATLPVLIGSGARAQTQAATPSSSSTTQTQTRTETVANAVRRMSRSLNAFIVADSGTAQKQIAIPTGEITQQGLEKQLDSLVRTLGNGATWAKLYLPAPPAGRSTYDGDAVADFAFAEAHLFGKIGAAPDNTVEILGQRVPADHADSYVAGLNLKPVYLITSTHSSIDWAQMSKDEQKQYAQAQGAQLANSDPATRQAFMQQHMAIMAAMMQQMSPDQRGQLFPGITLSFQASDGSTVPGKAIIVTPRQ